MAMLAYNNPRGRFCAYLLQFPISCSAWATQIAIAIYAYSLVSSGVQKVKSWESRRHVPLVNQGSRPYTRPMSEGNRGNWSDTADSVFRQSRPVAYPIESGGGL